MNPEEFNNYWNKHYSEAYPIDFELKNIYPNRWFRIHSLPGSKRYAETENEYQIILERQNSLITGIIGENAEIIISFGFFETESKKKNTIELIDFGEFKKAKTIELHKIRHEEYEDEHFYDVYYKTDVWKENSKNKMLKSIMNGKFRAMFICPKENCILSPYDGGMDLILDSEEKRNQLKLKYKEWLSEREDGL